MTVEFLNISFCKCLAVNIKKKISIKNILNKDIAEPIMIEIGINENKVKYVFSILSCPIIL
tara:strand:+ start:190 stop:372 length:183 start_codon:yes stop_codon:yes gene_type:complete